MKNWETWVYVACLELQRGQVVIMNKNERNTYNKTVKWSFKNKNSYLSDKENIIKMQVGYRR